MTYNYLGFENMANIKLFTGTKNQDENYTVHEAM